MNVKADHKKYQHQHYKTHQPQFPFSHTLMHPHTDFTLSLNHNTRTTKTEKKKTKVTAKLPHKKPNLFTKTTCILPNAQIR